MTAQEAHDISISMSSKLLTNILECIKQVATNGQYQYIFTSPIPDRILDELRRLGYTIETVNTDDRTGIKISW